MKPSKLHAALHALIGERVPLHIWGACGAGKSQIVSRVANDLNYEFVNVRAVQLDPRTTIQCYLINEGRL
jgi:MoxR-like ATPase